MHLATISEVSKRFNISTRTLRYYEQIGLLESTKKDGYAYRTYDEEAILRLQQIIILRKLRIPLKEIITILESESTAEIIETFRKNLSEVDEEITALSTIRSILNTFISRLSEKVEIDIKVNLVDDLSILEIVDTLSVTKNTFNGNGALEDLNKANEVLAGTKELRIIYLPPMTVASAHCISSEPERDAGNIIGKFVRETDLFTVKPDARCFGFNNPNPDQNGNHGYEFWVSIPDDMPVPSPLVKKRFAGGLYAVHTSNPINFEEWQTVFKWLENNGKFDYDPREPWGMDGLLEEHFNLFNEFKLKNTSLSKLLYIDFMIPIKEKDANLEFESVSSL